MLSRKRHITEITETLTQFPVCVLLGPRQCGKTTLAREIAATWPDSTFLDMENPRDAARLADPLLALENLRGFVALDEVQRFPKLFEILRVLADRRPVPARFLLLGSASPDIVRGVSETLAGRAGFVDMRGFSLDEIAPQDWERLWLRGGFPDSFLADSDAKSARWREAFSRTFLERDLPALGERATVEELRRTWTMLAHCHGQLWNGAGVANSLGVSAYALRRRVDLFVGAFMVRQLQPWFENAGKRVVKSPKLYLRDSGILHHLLGISTQEALAGHPVLGASWEGFALEETLTALGNPPAWFWRTQAGAELDLFVQRDGRRLGFEFKHTSSPKVSRSMHIAVEDLRLDKLFVVAPVVERFPLTGKIEACGLAHLRECALK
ncbi:MAG: ATP-binding protein [Puniceicoccales bacterium]|jgi:predicted AAA+ superfamily ATPase|nr:ATP-binding protein [Puniceicoccales bacterium]